MSRENWYQVDNVAKVFLATASKRDTRTLRVSCYLKEDIVPELLQGHLLFELGTAGVNMVLNKGTDLIGQLPDHRALLSGQAAHLLENGSQLTFFAEILYPECVQLFQIMGLCQF